MAELFEKFELDRVEPRGRRLLRLLGGSVIFHFLVLSLVLYVPSLRAAFQITNTLSNISFVDEAYQEPAIGERATMLTFSNSDGKFRYPDGYFAQLNQMNDGGDFVVPPPSPDDPVLIAQVRPTPLPIIRPTPVPSPSPTATPTPAATASPEAALAQNEQPATGEQTAAGANASPTPEQSKAEAELEKQAAEAGAKKFPPINKKPFTDWLEKAKVMKDAGDIDLSGTLEMTLEGDRQSDGTLTNVEVTGESASNPKLRELVLELVKALSASRVLIALPEDAKHLKLAVTVNQQAVDARVMTEVSSPDSATQFANGYSLLLAAARMKKAGREEEAIFNGVKISAEGKQINLNFNMPRDQATDMLKKQLPAAPAS